ncbi:MAG TPA: TRAP transporter small permease subunit [Labilithrix sp.]|nr:TRAP transporter small permease subunit [Labilithrix sp.]
MSEEDKGSRKPSSPWPSARKSETPAPPDASVASAKDPAAPAAAATGLAKKAWGAPFDKIDRAWSTIDARLCAFVLLADILTLVFWISLKALSSTGKAGSGFIFRVMLASAVIGGIAHVLTRKRVREHELLTSVFVCIGVLVGTVWGDAGMEYFGNLQGWLQNASILVFFGGASEMAKRFTLWLALLGASVATAQGKHITVDVVMRFLTPRARVPVAVVGWVAASVVCFAGVWGFFDHIAVEEYRAPTQVACPDGSGKTCPASAGSKIDVVLHDTGRDLFLAGRQLSLDLRTFPKVLAGTPYAKTLTAKDWNEWLRDGGWEKHFDAEKVKAMELPPEGDFRTPAVTSMPGGGEPILKILVREVNFVFAFGLLVIGLRFILRSLLAIAGWVKVDPNAAHGDEELAHVHDHSAQADLVETAIKETSR